jgi:peptidoglycan/LPS O-acetylase OafA/YrhL
VHAVIEQPLIAPAPRETRERAAYLDNLKVGLVASIIAVHGIVGYSSWEGAWAYEPAAEVRLATVTENVLGSLVLPATLFAMGLFFLMSGLVTPGSLTRKGPRRFARDRLVRLGIPLAVWALAIWPAVVFVAHRVAGETASYWTVFMNAEPFLDTGPMWFVAVLLIYSLAYAAWRSRRPPSGAAEPISEATLVRLAVVLSLATILVRLVFPFDGHQVGELQLWQWPQYLALFGLGIVAAQRGGLEPVPDRLRRRCGAAALLGLAAFFALLGAVVAAGLEPPDAFADLRLHWAPIALSAIEGPLAVAASVWLLGIAQRHLARPGPRAVARSAYGAFILQGPVLIGVALALRGVDVPAEVKALAVACAGVAVSFAVAWLLVSRTRLGRIL